MDTVSSLHISLLLAGHGHVDSTFFFWLEAERLKWLENTHCESYRPKLRPTVWASLILPVRAKLKCRCISAKRHTQILVTYLNNLGRGRQRSRLVPGHLIQRSLHVEPSHSQIFVYPRKKFPRRCSTDRLT